MNNKIMHWITALILLVSLVYALEIKSGTSEDITLFLKNSSSGTPIEGANCTLDVWNPSNTKILNDGNMTELGEGFYYYSTNSSWTALGDYRVMAKCQVGENSYYSAMSFEIVGTTVDEWFETINQTTQNTYNYLVNTLYPAVDDAESKLDDVLVNTSNIWNKLVEIQGNVTTNYNGITSNQNLITGTNFSIMNELENNRLRLADMNITISGILNNITQTVNPKLDQLQTDVDLIKDYTDTLEAGQASILGNLSEIQDKLDSLNTTTNQALGYVDTLEESLDCDGASDTPVCDRLAQINDTVNTINTNTDALESGQSTIINYVDTLESGQAAIIDDVDEAKQYLNCTINITNSMCWMLSLIGAYTDELESGQTTIIDNVGDLETNQTLILSELSAIKDYTDTLESGVADLDSDIQSWSSNATARFDTIDSSLTNIYTDTQALLAGQESLNDTQVALLNQIIVITTDANTTVHEVKDYLEGTVTDYLSQINETVIQINATVMQINETVMQINATVTEILNKIIDINTTLASIHSDTQSLLAKWGTYTAEQIYNKTTDIETKVDDAQEWLNSFNATEQQRYQNLISEVDNAEELLNLIRSEIGFNGTGYTAYSYLVQLDSKLVEINVTIINKIEFEANATRSQLEQAFSSNTSVILSDIATAQTSLNQILNKWGTTDAESIIANITLVRNDAIALQSWMDVFNLTEEIRHNESKSLLNNILAWLGIFNQTEAQRHQQSLDAINNVSASIDNATAISNTILTQLGYNGKSSTLSDEIYSVLNLLAVITNEINGFTFLDYVTLRNGTNIIVLPKQPTNISIGYVMANVTGMYSRVDYYDSETSAWLIYNPSNPFGNTLYNMTVDKIYWIYANQNATLWIK